MWQGRREAGCGAVEGQESGHVDLGDVPRHGAKEAPGRIRAGSAAVAE